MGHIHVTSGTSEIYVDHEVLAIFIIGHGVVTGFEDAAVVLSVVSGASISPKDVSDGISSSSRVGGITVRIATLPEVRARFPGYRVVRHGRGSPSFSANPTTVTFKIGPDIIRHDYRSMKSCRESTGLSVFAFEKISNKHHGWRSLLKGCMQEIVVNPPGWTPPRGRTFTGGRVTDILFETRKLASGSFSIKYIGPTTVPDFGSIPNTVLETTS